MHLERSRCASLLIPTGSGHECGVAAGRGGLPPVRRDDLCDSLGGRSIHAACATCPCTTTRARAAERALEVSTRTPASRPNDARRRAPPHPPGEPNLSQRARGGPRLPRDLRRQMRATQPVSSQLQCLPLITLLLSSASCGEIRVLSHPVQLCSDLACVRCVKIHCCCCCCTSNCTAGAS